MDKISIVIGSDDILEEGYEVASFLKKLYRKDEFKIQIDNFFNEFNKSSNSGETSGFNDLMKVYAGKEIHSISTPHLKSAFEKFISDIVGITFTEAAPISSLTMVANAIEEFKNEMKEKFNKIIETKNIGEIQNPTADSIIKETEHLLKEDKNTPNISSSDQVINTQDISEESFLDTSSSNGLINSILERDVCTNQKYFKHIYVLATEQGQDYVQSETMTLAHFFTENQSDLVKNFTDLQALLIQGNQIDRDFLERNIEKISLVTSGEKVKEKGYIVDETIVDETIVDETIVDETIVDETIVDETIVDETIVDETIVDETIVDETIVDETIVDETIVDIEAKLKSVSSKRTSQITSQTITNPSDVKDFLSDFIDCIETPLIQLPEDKSLIFAIHNLFNSEKKKFFTVLAMLIKAHLPYHKSAKRNSSIVANFLAGDDRSKTNEIRGIISEIENDITYNPTIDFFESYIKKIKEIMVCGLNINSHKEAIADNSESSGNNNTASRAEITKAIINGEKSISGNKPLNNTSIERKNLGEIKKIHSYFKDYSADSSNKMDAIELFEDLESFLKLNKDNLGLTYSPLSKITGIICSFLGFNFKDKEYKYLYAFLNAEGKLNQNFIDTLIVKTEKLLGATNKQTLQSQKISQKTINKFDVLNRYLVNSRNITNDSLTNYFNSFIKKFPQYNLEWLTEDLHKDYTNTHFKSTLISFYSSLDKSDSIEADYFLEGLIIMLKAKKNGSIITIPNSDYYFDINTFYDFFLFRQSEYSSPSKSKSAGIVGFNFTTIKEILENSQEVYNNQHPTNKLLISKDNQGKEYKIIVDQNGELIVTIICNKNLTKSIVRKPQNSIMADSLQRATQGEDTSNSVEKKVTVQKPTKIVKKAPVKKETVTNETIAEYKDSVKNTVNTGEENMGDLLIEDINVFNPINQFTKEFFNTIKIGFSALGENGRNKFKEVIGTNQKAEVTRKVLLYILNRFLSNIVSDPFALESIIHLVINEPYLQGSTTVKKFLKSIEYYGKKDEETLRNFLLNLKNSKEKGEEKNKASMETVAGIRQHTQKTIPNTSAIIPAKFRDIKNKIGKLPSDEKRTLYTELLNEKYYGGNQLHFAPIFNKVGYKTNNNTTFSKKDSHSLSSFLLGESDTLKLSNKVEELIIKLFIHENLKK